MNHKVFNISRGCCHFWLGLAWNGIGLERVGLDLITPHLIWDEVCEWACGLISRIYMELAQRNPFEKNGRRCG